MHLNSSAFDDYGKIPQRFTADGENVSPALEWSDVPSGCKSLALLCEDLDAPKKSPQDPTFTHWVVYNISPSISALHEGLEKKEELHDPLRIDQGMNSFGRVGYDGPKPPSGDLAHRYIFTLFALDIENLGPARAELKTIHDTMNNHILKTAQITGRYERQRPAQQQSEEHRPSP
ncbi:YbhB/YbcL family Raf kinase inhibitor-like protein [Pseudobdellovibrio sp. HCB154]|uniref:YbhB/YbcL family Raf kinase inhibitor-like protein n=1 Tax=Pseudobdellovibrio sp. HCB154 TaxID=3386277 RepID=UPI0039174026